MHNLISIESIKLTRKHKKAERKSLRPYALNAVKHRKLYPLSVYDVSLYSFSSNKSGWNAKMGKLLLTCIFNPLVPDVH